MVALLISLGLFLISHALPFFLLMIACAVVVVALALARVVRA